MKFTSSPFPHHVVGSAFLKQAVASGMVGSSPSQRARSRAMIFSPAVLVSASAIMSRVGQYRSSTRPLLLSSANRAARTAKYLVRHVPPNSATRSADLLSTSKSGGSSSQHHSTNNAWSPSTICHPVAAALTSASQVDSAEDVWREERHKITEPPQTMMTPVCDLVLTPAKLASVHVISCLPPLTASTTGADQWRMIPWSYVEAK